MSTRPQIKPYIVIPNSGASPANTGSMATSITSLPSIIDNIPLPSYSVSWSGASPIGALSVQVSDDYSLNAVGAVMNPGTWATMPLNLNGAVVTSIPVTGSTGNGIIDINSQTSVYAIRLVYTATSGTGTLQAIITAKVS